MRRCIGNCQSSWVRLSSPRRRFYAVLAWLEEPPRSSFGTDSFALAAACAGLDASVRRKIQMPGCSAARHVELHFLHKGVQSLYICSARKRMR